MARSTHHLEYRALLALLRDLREGAGITQSEMAETLGNTQTFISKVERGERRIDVVEFVEFCEALEVDPLVAFRELLARRSTQKRGGKKLSSRI